MERFSEKILKQYEKDGQFCPYCQSKNYRKTDEKRESYGKLTFFRCTDCSEYWIECHKEILTGLIAVDLKKNGILDPIDGEMKLVNSMDQVRELRRVSE